MILIFSKYFRNIFNLRIHRSNDKDTLLLVFLKKN